MASAVGVGIDVAKDKVDIATSDGVTHQVVRQSARELAALARKLAKMQVHRVVVEASGGYEADVLIALHEQGLPVVLVQPGRARSFARGIGKLAKTDAIDAWVLSRMALVGVDDTPLWQPLPADTQRLRALVHRRLQLVRQIDAETKRKRGASGFALESIERSLAFHRTERATIEAEINTLIA